AVGQVAGPALPWICQVPSRGPSRQHCATVLQAGLQSSPYSQSRVRSEHGLPAAGGAGGQAVTREPSGAPPSAEGVVTGTPEVVQPPTTVASASTRALAQGGFHRFRSAGIARIGNRNEVEVKRGLAPCARWRSAAPLPFPFDCDTA